MHVAINSNTSNTPAGIVEHGAADARHATPADVR